MGKKNNKKVVAQEPTSRWAKNAVTALRDLTAVMDSLAHLGAATRRAAWRWSLAIPAVATLIATYLHLAS